MQTILYNSILFKLTQPIGPRLIIIACIARKLFANRRYIHRFKAICYSILFMLYQIVNDGMRHSRRFWHATRGLRSAIRRHHFPQMEVLSQIRCFWERMVVFQILLDGAEPRDVGTT